MPESAMRTKTFRPYDQDTLLLMPPSVRDWVAPDSLPAFISDLVDDLDLAPFLAAHDEPRGMPPYHPAMMLKVLLWRNVSQSWRVPHSLAMRNDQELGTGRAAMS